MYYSINTVTFSSRDYELISKLHKLFIECYSNSSNGQNLVKHLFEVGTAEAFLICHVPNVSFHI